MAKKKSEKKTYWGRKKIFIVYKWRAETLSRAFVEFLETYNKIMPSSFIIFVDLCLFLIATSSKKF